MNVVIAIARRQVIRTVRRPQTLMPMLLVPTMFLAVVSGGGARATELDRFPGVDSFFDFVLAGSIIQATLLAGLMTGVALALDIETGFFDRIVTAPIARFQLVLGRLVGGAVIATMQALLFMTIGLIFGADLKGGLLGALIVIVLAILTASAAGAGTMALALKTRSPSVVQAMFPFVFVGLFFSSTFFPREMLTGPARTVADYNPISYIVEGVRDPIISEISAGDLLLGLASGVGSCGAMILLSVWMLHTRVGDA